MNEPFEDATVGDIVASDFRTAAVFERFGIDFCCGGRRSLADACQTSSADLAEVIRELSALSGSKAADDDVGDWPVDRLIDLIVSRHHAYLKSVMPVISRYLVKLERVHADRHPELTRVRLFFERIQQDLMQHMLKEEQVLFPWVRELAANAAQPGGPPMSPIGTVENPIRMMEREHQEAADELRLVRELTKGYTVPTDGCMTYATCMAELEAFERDLHRHVHLENNVLFPKALELERSGWRLQ